MTDWRFAQCSAADDFAVLELPEEVLRSAEVVSLLDEATEAAARAMQQAPAGSSRATLYKVAHQAIAPYVALAAACLDETE